MSDQKRRTIFVALGKAGKFFIFLILTAMVLMVFINAVARYLFATNFPIFEELARFAFVWTAILGAILAYKEGKHVGVDVLVTSLKGKKKLAVQLLAHAIIIGCLAVVGVGAWNYFKITAATPAPSSHLPFGVISVTGLILTVWMMVIAVNNVISDLRKFKKEKGKGE